MDAEDVDLLLEEKEQIIRKSGTLEFYSTPERFGNIGGLDNLKAWLRQRGRLACPIRAACYWSAFRVAARVSRPKRWPPNGKCRY